MGFEEPRGQHSVFRHPVQDAVRPHDRRVDGAGQDQEPDEDDQGVEGQPRRFRPDDAHRQAADQVVLVGLDPRPVGDDHHGEEADQRGQQEAVQENDECRLLEVRQLGTLDLAVDLGQGLFAAHREHRVAERDQDAEHPDQAEPIHFRGVAQLLGHRSPGEPAERILLLAGDLVDDRSPLRVHLAGKVGSGRGQVAGLGADGNGQETPGDHHDAHHRGRGHDLQGLVAGLADTPDVALQKYRVIATAIATEPHVVGITKRTR